MSPAYIWDQHFSFGGVLLCPYSPKFSSVAQLCQTLCEPMDCSTPGLPVHHQLLEFTQTHVHRVGDAIHPSKPVVPFSSHLQSFQASGSFQINQFSTGGQSTGVSASASVLSISIQGWFPLRLTGLISLLSKGITISQLESINAMALSLLHGQLSHPYMTTGQNPSFD